MRWRLDPGQIEVVDEDVAACLRRLTPAQKLAQIGEANQTLRAFVRAGVRRRHPGWAEVQVLREVARRMTRDSA
jgi:hypothetical protein